MQLSWEFVLIWVLIWFGIFGAPAYWLSFERGRSRGIWFTVGLFLGPVELLMLGFAPVLAAGEYEPCRACREAVRSGAVTCPHCGSDVYEPSTDDVGNI